MQVVSLVCFAICALNSASSPSAGDLPFWSRNYDVTVEHARSANRPLLLVLENAAEPGQQFEQAMTAASIDHADLLSRFELCRLDVATEIGRRIADGYSVSTYPYAIITDSSCERIVFRSAGQLNGSLWRKTLSIYGGKPRRSPEDDIADGDVESNGAFQAKRISVAQREAKRHRRPLVVYVSTDDCPYCEKMQQDTLDDPSVVQEVRASFDSVLVDCRDEHDWAEQHELRLFPTTLVFGANGKLIDRMEGYVKPSDFLHRLQTSRQDLISSLW